MKAAAPTRTAISLEPARAHAGSKLWSLTCKTNMRITEKVIRSQSNNQQKPHLEWSFC